MSRCDHLKQPKTFEEQLNILIERNLAVEDKEQALGTLSHINYYRLTAYALAYKEQDAYQKGLSFSTVHALYEFDKKLRNLLMGTIESIEIAFRTHIAYLIGHKYGALGYLNPENFVSEKIHERTMERIDLEISRSDELFVAHHKEKYGGRFPVWVAIELTSFGVLSKTFSNLKKEDQEWISRGYYGVPHYYAASWLHALTTIRNICAHYGRIYNRPLSIKPKLHRMDVEKGVRNNTLFGILVVMGKLTISNTEWKGFVTSLAALVETYDVVDIKLLGFPENWDKILLQL